MKVMRGVIATVSVVGIAGCALLFGTAKNREWHVGDPVPDLTLGASDGKEYNLASFAGKQAVVIAWFPKAFTGG